MNRNPKRKLHVEINRKKGKHKTTLVHTTISTRIERPTEELHKRRRHHKCKYITHRDKDKEII